MENANLVKIECVTITVRMMVVEEIKLTKTCALIVWGNKPQMMEPFILTLTLHWRHVWPQKPDTSLSSKIYKTVTKPDAFYILLIGDIEMHLRSQFLDHVSNNQ